MKSQFYNSNGELTKYALFCGYVEKKETNNAKKQMYIEHNHIHVRHHKFTEASIIEEQHEVFEADQLTKARKLFKNIKIN